METFAIAPGEPTFPHGISVARRAASAESGSVLQSRLAVPSSSAKGGSRTPWVFLGVFAVLLGLAKVYEIVVERFIPSYGDTFQLHGFFIYFGLFLLAIGLTAVWRLNH